ncbi:hypothetical protein U9M48_010965 [Paspalum notatum var. saurae]|uniref:Uncharacterized protein n=1 Tax=Paspalum notatum var. saurae TaxID=547442 RepID=A0AAQ3SUL8_PASNO
MQISQKQTSVLLFLAGYCYVALMHIQYIDRLRIIVFTIDMKCLFHTGTVEWERPKEASAQSVDFTDEFPGGSGIVAHQHSIICTRQGRPMGMRDGTDVGGSRQPGTRAQEVSDVPRPVRL